MNRKKFIIFILVLLPFISSCISENNPKPAQTQLTPEGNTTSSASGGSVIDWNDDFQHVFGQPILGGSDYHEVDIPLTILFFKGSQHHVTSDDIHSDANKTVSMLNEYFKTHSNNHQHLRFYLKETQEIMDPVLYNVSACDLDRMNYLTEEYGREDSMVLSFVHNINGCAGAAWVWAFPSQKQSIAMVEYRHAFEHNSWTPVVHEIGHILGFHHSYDDGPQQISSTGKVAFNSMVSSLGISINRIAQQCPVDFFYFSDLQPNQENRFVTEFGQVSSQNNQGVRFAPLYNTMYPSFFQGKRDDGFFNSQGYAYSFSWGFDCWLRVAHALDPDL